MKNLVLGAVLALNLVISSVWLSTYVTEYTNFVTKETVINVRWFKDHFINGNVVFYPLNGLCDDRYFLQADGSIVSPAEYFMCMDWQIKLNNTQN